MNNVCAFIAQESGGSENETQFERPFRRRRAKRQVQFPRTLSEFALTRSSQPNVLTQLPQAGSQLDALIIRASAGEHRIQMHDAERAGSRVLGLAHAWAAC
jgi:hypothetical protein